jgi:hypothetical protein
MRILATISDQTRLGVVLDVESGSTHAIPVRPEFLDHTITDRAPCRPFGITWCADELYIANNRQLIVLDKNLDYARTLATPLQVNVHQLAFQGDRIWAVSPWTNSLIAVHPHAVLPPIEFDLTRATLQPYVPRDASEADDQFHFNSLLWANGTLYVAAHRFGAGSFINYYRGTALRLYARLSNVGAAIHGLAYDQGDLYWLSTNTGEIRSSKGLVLPLSKRGFARGFAMTEEFFVVAISDYLSRPERVTGNSWVQLIDRKSGKVIQEYHLLDTGSINDLRILDRYDFGHCVAPIWK